MSTPLPSPVWNIARYRMAIGLTQRACARAMHVAPSTWIRWETGRANPMPHHAKRLSRLLHVSMALLRDRQIAYEGDPYP
jgi:transcriptional regulator with XRE-family HTH domain